MIFSKEILSAIAIALTLIAFMPYISSILQGTTRPHVFSWIIWGSTTFVVFLAQLSDDGGAGAWPIGVSGIITIFVAILAYLKQSDNSITKTDWLFFMAALTSLPLWYVTSDPLWAVIILTVVDVLGFGPTIRKANCQPYEENLIFYAIVTLRNIISVAALEHYSLTTILFPVVMAAACVLFISLVLYRRKIPATCS